MFSKDLEKNVHIFINFPTDVNIGNIIEFTSIQGKIDTSILLPRLTTVAKN